MEPSRSEIWKMFDTISGTYDRVNRCMTFGLDKYWRNTLSSHLPAGENLQVLDCATGTGDQILSLLKTPSIEKITGVDLAEEMLAIGRKKIAGHPLQNKVEFVRSCALSLPFAEDRFDCITLSFGIRNVLDVGACLQELLRVLKPGGRLLILETSLPKNPVIRLLHLTYLRTILPTIGGWISRKKYAYRYLHKTAETFPCGERFCHMLQEAGFVSVKHRPLTLGAVSVYIADKKPL